MNPISEPLPLSQYNKLITATLAIEPRLLDAWVTAETSDVRLSGGHCYLELVEKSDDGRQLAKIRATIWSSRYYAIADKFARETGERFRSDLKVMVCVSANFHPLYGLSVNITDINASYTIGDTLRRRKEILSRLQADGILEENRSLPWPAAPLRIAVISAAGAAGYGDFMDQLHHNPYGLRFTTELFPAIMQGENTAPSIISALELIANDSRPWQCVVIIRGGGASTDLLCFDNYDLAANIAAFPLPIIIGIGHERDVTVLDYVANMRVKTPTAAAEWLIQKGADQLARLHRIASDLLAAVTDRFSGCHRQLSYIAGLLPAAVSAAITHSKTRLDSAQSAIISVADRRVRPEKMRLDSISQRLRQTLESAIARERQRVESMQRLTEALSPQSTLRRGYSITMADGHAIKTAAGILAGARITTLLADGELQSIVTHKE